MVSVKGLEGMEICRYVFTDGGVGAAAGLNSGDPGRREGISGCQEFGVFAVGVGQMVSKRKDEKG